MSLHNYIVIAIMQNVFFLKKIKSNISKLEDIKVERQKD